MMKRLRIVGLITLRSTAIGLATGSVMGAFSGLGDAILMLIYRSSAIDSIYSVGGWGMLGAAFGLVLGIGGGLLLGIVTSLFFYPLERVRLYRVIAPAVGTVIAGSGAATWGPWHFSSTSMTPTSAVVIGLGSVLASLVAGWTGVLAAQNIVRWYEQWERKQVSADGYLISAGVEAAPSPDPPEASYSGTAASFRISPSWIGIALLACVGSIKGYLPLRWLVCGTTDVITCLPSPRLYTSVIAGFKVTLPILLVSLLASVLLKKLSKRYRY